eukprot:2595465-Prymnesium_polylepis.1
MGARAVNSRSLPTRRGPHRRFPSCRDPHPPRARHLLTRRAPRATRALCPAREALMSTTALLHRFAAIGCGQRNGVSARLHEHGRWAQAHDRSPRPQAGECAAGCQRRG